MPSRYAPSSLGYRGQTIDLETARQAVAQVVSERDALAQQLSRAQGAITSLRRQIDARRAESEHLAHANRALEAQQARADDQGLTARFRRQLEQVSTDNAHLVERLERAESRVGHLELDHEEAVADRDRERAVCRQLETALAEVHQASPNAQRAQQLAADLANVRRHRDEAIVHGIREETTRILTEVASIRDTVERAIEASPHGSGPHHDGMLAILSKVDAVFSRERAELTGRVGERFDPRLHEAVSAIEGRQPGIVTAVVSSGLVLEDGTVALAARVVVTA